MSLRRTPMPRPRKAMNRGKGFDPQKRAQLQRRRTALKKIGKKGRASARATRIFKKECERLGITTCELRYPCCFYDNYLTPAHSKKRRNLTPFELDHEQILACAPCHRVLDEDMSHDEMRAEVLRVLEERKQAA